MSKLILYGSLASPPVRTALLTLKELGLEYEFVTIDMMKGEHKSEEYLKKNPQHTVPMLEDGDQYIWDSHAIAAYLVRKYGKTDSLYPKDFYPRAVVDQRLHFDSGVLFARSLKGFMSPHLSMKEKAANVVEGYELLEAFLDHTYIAGEQLTIADLSILATVSTLNLIVPIESSKTPKLLAWMELMQQLPYYDEINVKGLEMVAEMIKPMIAAATAAEATNTATTADAESV